MMVNWDGRGCGWWWYDEDRAGRKDGRRQRQSRLYYRLAKGEGYAKEGRKDEPSRQMPRWVGKMEEGSDRRVLAGFNGAGAVELFEVVGALASSNCGSLNAV